MKKIFLLFLTSGIITFSYAQPGSTAKLLSEGNNQLQFRNDFTEKLDSSWFRVFDKSTGEWSVRSKAHYTYNAQNLLAAATYEFFDAQTGLFEYNHREEFLYNDLGQATTYHFSTFNEVLNDWKRLSTETYSYDANGNLAEHVAIHWDVNLEELINESKINTTYSATNKVTERIWYNWDRNTNDWIESSKNVMTYTAQDSIHHTERYFYIPGSGIWEISDSIFYTYDNQHYLISQETWIDIGFGLEPYVRVTFVNNVAGQPVTRTQDFWDENALDWVPSSLSENTYNANGKVERFSYYNWNPIGEYWEGFVKHEFSYTPAGDKDIFIQSNWDDDMNDWVLSSSDENVYDESVDGSSILWPQLPNEPEIHFGKKLLYDIQSIYNKNNAEWELDQSSLFFYSGIVSLAPVTFREHSVFPNPALNHIYIDVTSPSPVLEVELFDIKGQLVQTGVLIQGRAFSIAYLPPGLYSYRMRNDSKQLTGRFVKQ